MRQTFQSSPTPNNLASLILVFSKALFVLLFLVENFVWRILCMAHFAVCLGGAVYLFVVVAQIMHMEPTNPLVLEEGRFVELLLFHIMTSECMNLIGWIAYGNEPLRC